MLVYIGIDWSEAKHDVCFMNEAGEVLSRMVIEHTLAGFQQMDAMRIRYGIGVEECWVGIETHHTILVDYLVEQGYRRLYVLPPNSVKSAQGRYRQSGAKSDRADAQLIADMLRTDHQQYQPWIPDSDLTRQIRAKVSLVSFLNKHIWQTGNRLRSVLIRYYPSALEGFSTLDSPITLAWIFRYPTPQAASLVTFAQFQAFAREHHHTRPKKWATIFHRLQQGQPKAAPAIVAGYAEEAQVLARLLLEMVRSKANCLAQLEALYTQHPDYPIYHSLPAAGTYLEPALLAMLGDHRERFPNHHVLQAMVGTCPVTRQSGKSKLVTFRTACNHPLRQIVQQWAKLSIQASPWAAGYYQTVRPHCNSENEAYRRLANRWLEILWRLWYDRQPYDELRHLSSHARRLQSKS